MPLSIAYEFSLLIRLFDPNRVLSYNQYSTPLHAHLLNQSQFISIDNIDFVKCNEMDLLPSFLKKNIII